LNFFAFANLAQFFHGFARVLRPEGPRFSACAKWFFLLSCGAGENRHFGGGRCLLQLV